MDEALLMLSEFYGFSWPPGMARSCAKTCVGAGYFEINFYASPSKWRNALASAC